MFTVGPVQENAYVVRADAASERALLIDPGEEPQRLLDAVASLGVKIEAILITHCHFDHIGAVAPVAAATCRSSCRITPTQSALTSGFPA